MGVWIGTSTGLLGTVRVDPIGAGKRQMESGDGWRSGPGPGAWRRGGKVVGDGWGRLGSGEEARGHIGVCGVAGLCGVRERQALGLVQGCTGAGINQSGGGGTVRRCQQCAVGHRKHSVWRRILQCGGVGDGVRRPNAPVHRWGNVCRIPHAAGLPPPAPPVHAARGPRQLDQHGGEGEAGGADAGQPPVLLGSLDGHDLCSHRGRRGGR